MAFGQSSRNCHRSQALSKFPSFKPFPVAAPWLYLNIPAGHRSLEPFSSLLSSTLSTFSPRRFFSSGKLCTSVAWSCDETNTWFSVTQDQLFFSEMALCRCLRWNEKVLANKSRRSHFCFGCWQWRFCLTFAKVYLCQQVSEKLKRS